MTPDDIPRLAAAGFAAAAVVLCGAGYAILLAPGRVRRKPVLCRAALAAYAGVVVAAVALAWALRLDGFWLALVALLLIGYFVAPRAVWRLSLATHALTTERGYQVPVIGDEAPLFGRKLSDAEAERLVGLGKLTAQAKNCMHINAMIVWMLCGFSNAVWCVRADARKRTHDVVVRVLTELLPGHELRECLAPYTKATQTALYGDKAQKLGEVDLYFTPRTGVA